MVTPEKTALSRPADFVVLPAFSGEMGVLPGHEPFFVQLQAGELRVTAGEELMLFSISGGFAEVLGDKVSVFAETAEMASEIDAERARQGLEKARAAIARKGEGTLSLEQADAMIRRESARLHVAAMKGRRGSRPHEGR
jgi:F-type H+-transporting ATPase subunit epsilon